ncbi:hypothetical protein COT52_00970, partial [candidate division WWE3 bacterium CG08_land_8_20_14_0_20_43_13]
MYDIEHYSKQDDIAFMLDLSDIYGEPILDIGCGTGRISIPLAKKGKTVYCLDKSKEMLTEFKHKLKALTVNLRPRIHLSNNNMLDFTFNGVKFPLIICSFNTFYNLVNTEERDTFLTKMREHLSGCGRLVIDLITPTSGYLNASNQWQLEKSNLLPNGLLSERYYRLIEKQEDRQVMKVEFHTVLKKKEEIITDWFFNYTTAYLYNDQLPEILKRNGLFPESTYCDYDKTSFNACSNPQRQIFIIKKSGIMKSDNRIVIAMKSYYRERKAANDPDLEFLPFIKKNNFAYLMGVIYNQGMSADHTWKIPQMLHKRIGFFTVIDFAKVDLKNIEDAFYTRPSLHRYWKTMARYTKQAALKLVDEYAGETGNIWNDKPAVDTLYNRLLSFKGIGPKKANMAIRALALSFG